MMFIVILISIIVGIFIGWAIANIRPKSNCYILPSMKYLADKRKFQGVVDILHSQSKLSSFRTFKSRN